MPPLVGDLDHLTPGEAACFREEMRRVRASHPVWRVQIQGSVIQFFRVGCQPPEYINRKREAVGLWSQQSRMKMLRLLNRIDYAKIRGSLFVTLTYPDHVRREDYRLRSVDRAVFLRYVERELGRRVACLWRIEWEERKSGTYTGNLAPHFHLMLFGVEFLAWQFVRERWRETIRAGEGPLVTEVKAIYNQDGACRYLSKYVSKYRSLDISTYHNSGIRFGRHWGVCRRELIPLAPIVVARSLTDEEVTFVRGFAAARWKWYEPSVGGGYTLLSAEHAKRFSAWLNSSCPKN